MGSPPEEMGPTSFSLTASYDEASVVMDASFFVAVQVLSVLYHNQRVRSNPLNAVINAMSVIHQFSRTYWPQEMRMP